MNAKLVIRRETEAASYKPDTVFPAIILILLFCYFVMVLMELKRVAEKDFV